MNWSAFSPAAVCNAAPVMLEIKRASAPYVPIQRGTLRLVEDRHVRQYDQFPITKSAEV